MDPTAGAVVAPRWVPRRPLRLHWREWGGDSVVYDGLGGETHQFTPLAAATMAWLEDAPHSTAELTAAIANELGSVADDELQQAVAAALERFRELDWIESLTRT